MENPVRRTTSEIIKKMKFVRINRGVIENLANKWLKEKIKIPSWSAAMHFATKNTRVLLTYLIVLDALNFCFWRQSPEDERWMKIYQGQKYNGYFALSLALREFFENFPAKSNFDYFSKISFREFRGILGGGVGPLLLRGRWQALRAVSRIMVEKYNSDPIKFIAKAKNKLAILVPQIARELPSFNDVAQWRGQKICFWKRAQVLALDIYGAFAGKGPGRFDDLDYVTAFADYKVPQILRHLGVLEYEPSLAGKVDRRVLIRKGSRAEIEIRAATIWAVEYIKEALRRGGQNFYSFEIDWILWNASQQSETMQPYHLTKTIYY